MLNAGVIVGVLERGCRTCADPPAVDIVDIGGGRGEGGGLVRGTHGVEDE